MFVLRSSKAYAAGPDHNASSPLLSLPYCGTDRQSGRGRMDAWINPSIHSFRPRRWLSYALFCLAVRARELVINLCVTLFVNGDKKKDRLRRMRRWRLLHCFNLSQYITSWLASKKSKPSILGRHALGHLSSFWRASADFYVQLFGSYFPHRV